MSLLPHHSPAQVALVTLPLLLLSACGNATRPKAEAPEPAQAAAQSPAPTSTPARSAAIDAQEVAAVTGVDKVDTSADGVVKASFPRQDVEVSVDGWKMPPFMGLTSWAAFSRARAGVAEAMVMGDLVLFEDEVNPVMSVLFNNGVTVTALHNHFFYDAPKVFFMHIGGEGTVAALGRGVRGAMEKVVAIRKMAPKPASTFGAPAVPVKSSIDGAKLEAILGVKGQSKDGMFKVTIGRRATASCGCLVGKAMGVNTWAAFGGSDDIALVDGDFAVAEDELQGVLKTLRAGEINIVAIHHHMTGESPRVLFLHYWGKGGSVDLAATLRKALDLTAVDKT